MFDIGFMEIMVVLIVALIVIGPERMPEVARQIGRFMGRAKRFVNSMKENSEISDTVRELKESIDFEEERKQLTDISQQIDDDLAEATQPTPEMDMTDFARPFDDSFENSLTRDSQFNKAPQQPQLPPTPPETKTDTATLETVETNSPEVTATKEHDEPAVSQSKPA